MIWSETLENKLKTTRKFEKAQEMLDQGFSQTLHTPQECYQTLHVPSCTARTSQTLSLCNECSLPQLVSNPLCWIHGGGLLFQLQLNFKLPGGWNPIPPMQTFHANRSLSSHSSLFHTAARGSIQAIVQNFLATFWKKKIPAISFGLKFPASSIQVAFVLKN